MRQIDVHFASGQDFLDDYKFFLGALTVAKPQKARSVKPGQRVMVACRFGEDQSPYQWSGLVLDTSMKNAEDRPGWVIKFDQERLDEVEQVVWSYTRGSAARREARLQLMVALDVLAEHRGGIDARRVSVQDLSHNGCQLIQARPHDAPFLLNHSLKLRWRNGEVTGRVCWAEGQRFGVVFDAPLAEVGNMMCFDPV